MCLLKSGTKEVYELNWNWYEPCVFTYIHIDGKLVLEDQQAKLRNKQNKCTLLQNN
jgi:hypothetical protein